jgi:hypothetical protein
MKNKVLSIFILAVSILMFHHSNSVAQTSEFKYRGELIEDELPANGIYDLQFSLYDAVTNGNQVGVSLTNATTLVSNGVFTVVLDFGSSVFDGSARWIETGARTNGVDPYLILSPREAVTSVPYAIQAAKANYVAANNVAGTLSLAQLPTEVLTNDATNANLSGAFFGNGIGLTNVPGALPVQVLSGTNGTLQANGSYLLTNSASTIVTLPASPNLGDLVTVSGVGSNGWQIGPNSGQSIIGANGSGWVARETAHNWQCVASSADGTKLVALEQLGSIWVSTNSGVQWNVSFATNLIWSCLASSSNGARLVAAVDNGLIYTSTNSGTTWAARTNVQGPWKAIASGTNGIKLVAVQYSGQIYTSGSAGQSWFHATQLASGHQ